MNIVFKISFCVFLAALAACDGKTQLTSISMGNSAAATESNSTYSPVFPDDWAGDWTGELKIYRQGKEIQTVPVEMEISPLADGSGFNWITRYLDEKETKKNYKLITIDKENGHYQIDEGPIKLDSYLNAGKLSGWFVAGDVLIFSQYEIAGDKLVFELTSGQLTDVPEDPSTGTVTPLPINVVQRMVLERT